MMFARLRLPLFAIAIFSFLVSLWAKGLLANEPISDVQMRFFESEVRPLLAAFINDKATDAYERLLDELLNSRGYGER